MDPTTASPTAPSPTPDTGDQAAPPGPTMNYFVKRGDDSTYFSDHDVANQYQKQGYNVLGTTDDGLKMLTQGPPGPNGEPGQQLTVPIDKALKKEGYSIQGYMPINPDPSTTEPFLSGMIDQMPEDDNMKKSYIEHVLSSRGIENPKVTGMGSNWHVYNPENKQWAQLSKEPGFDLGGLASLGLGLPHMIGSLVGGTAGALGGEGFLSVPGAAAGAAAGSATGSALKDVALSQFDPDYAAALKGNLGSEATSALKTAGWDALGEGIGAPIAKALGPVVSPVAEGIGSALEGGGSLVSQGAGTLARSPGAVAGLDFLNPIPGVGATTQAATALQAPAELTKFAANAPGWLAENPITSPLFSEESQAGMGALTQALTAKGQTAESILGGLSRAPKAAAAYAADPASQAAEAEAANAAMLLHQGPFSEEGLNALAEMGAKNYRAADIAKRMSQGSEEANVGAKIGKMMDQAAAAGSGLQSAANLTTKGLLRGTQGLGVAAQIAGKAIPPASAAARWAGLPWAVRYGLVPLGKNYYENENPP